MSEITWHLYRSRWPSKGVIHAGTCTAPDVHAAITIFAHQTGQHHTEFARSLPAWQQQRTRYYVQSDASRKLEETP